MDWPCSGCLCFFFNRVLNMIEECCHVRAAKASISFPVRPRQGGQSFFAAQVGGGVYVQLVDESRTVKLDEPSRE